MPDVDVIIPCYRYAHYLRGCVGSVLSQTDVRVRAIIMDDASPDDTEAVGRALAAEDARVCYHRNATNLGHIATYNRGIGLATAKYFVLLSADDLLATGALGRAVRLMEHNPEVGMVFGKSTKWHSDHLPDFSEPDGLDGTWVIHPKGEFVRNVCRTGENIVSTPSVVVRTEWQQRLGGYDPTLPHSGDLEMWLRFAAVGAVAELNARQAYYRFHAANMHRPYMQHVHRDLLQRRDAFRQFFRAFEHTLADPTALERSAGRALAIDALNWAAEALEGRIPDRLGDLLAFARDVYPRATRTGQWHRLRMKRLLGTTGLRLARSARRLVSA
jgi:glycosyltransferase involved in cell wall biosynthesis